MGSGEMESNYSDEEHEIIDLQYDEGNMSVKNEDELDDEEEGRQYQEYLEQKKKEHASREDLEFPDEIDTPMDVPARVRFQRQDLVFNL